MNKLFRTLVIFIFLLSSRAGIANPFDINGNKTDRSDYSTKEAQTHDLDGLFSISSDTFEMPQQASSSLIDLHHQAYAAQAELTQLLQDVSEKTQAQLLIPEVKSYPRAAAKVANKFNGDARKITDLARASVVTDSIESLMQAYTVLSERTQVVQQKNRFAEPKASGYRDLNMLVRLPKSGMIAEVQLHLHDIAEIKSGPEHQVYQQVQGIEANAKSQQRALSEFELTQIAQLRQSSHKLYHKAWLTYKREASSNFATIAAA